MTIERGGLLQTFDKEKSEVHEQHTGPLNRFKSAHLSGTQICKALVPRDQFEQGRGSHHRVATVYN